VIPLSRIFVATALTVALAGVATAAEPYVAWGLNNSGQSTLPQLPEGCSFGLGNLHSLAVTPAGAVIAWGANGYGQCDVPSNLPPSRQVAAGGWFDATDQRGFSVALLASGTVRAWGCNDYGQCSVPPGLDQVVEVGCGWSHSVALRSDFSVVVWGAGTNGNYDPNWGQRSVPTGLGHVTSISTKGCHILALCEDGTLKGWGRGAEGQLNIPAGTHFAQVSAGSDHSLGLSTDGRVLAWGWDYLGQASVPAVVQAQRAKQVAASLYGSLALLEDGSVHAWGHVTITAPYNSVPTDLPANSRLAVGGYHVIATTIAAEISGVIPPSGPASGGTEITISGSGFSEFPVVRIGGKRLSQFTRVSSSKILAVTPANLPGNTLVEVDGFRATAFYYRPECGSDLDQNGSVDGGDMSILLLDWGTCYSSVQASQSQDPPGLMVDEPAQRAVQR
jgi:hypothetical protein